jgi:CheY-like chemotaxis protein/predicted regulator of Ras-like GTPase activity (Roadblock/LC7/MglB family)
MDTVLIVDDDSKLTYLLQESLSKYESQFNVIFAEDGLQATEFLEKTPISLVVTDLQMPRMDGLDLLAHISENYPSLPCIVMTAHSTPEVLEKLPRDLLTFLQKPFKIKALSQAIFEGLSMEVTDGSLTGISVANFLQLIEMEEKSCLFEVKSPDGKGIFYFQEGELYDAIFGDLKGESAAMKMIALDSVKIRFLKLPNKKIARRVRTGLMNLIMEAMRLKDEAKNKDEELEFGAEADSEEYGTGAEITGNPLEDEIIDAAGADVTESVNTDTPILNKEDFVMALESYIQELKEIKGYKAAAIMNFTGEVLAYDSSDDKVDLAEVGATFNDIFRSSHEASKKVGLDACRELVIQTPKGLIVMECSGVDAVVHFHLIAVMSHDGNQALMKLRMGKIIPAIMKELD